MKKKYTVFQFYVSLKAHSFPYILHAKVFVLVGQRNNSQKSNLSHLYFISKTEKIEIPEINKNSCTCIYDDFKCIRIVSSA